MDYANMGGVVCEDPLAVEPPEELIVEMLIQYFIVELYKIRQKTNEGTRAPLRVVQNLAPDLTQRDAKKADEMDNIREFIARKLTRKLLRIVGAIQSKHRDSVYDEDLQQQFVFPILPGSYLAFTNPVLEFVKFVCAILGLAQDYQVEIGLLKRNLLELVGVREFASDAVFRNPCETLKLSNIPCKLCDSLRDFDFCRDPELMPSNLDVGPPKWICSGCGGEYDRVAIELELIRMLNSVERAFVQQDLKCTKCKQIRSDNVSRYCQCSGAYQLTLGKAEVRRKLKTILNVSIVHGLSRLKECAQITLENW
ncbi:hypothetical protein F5J12DRAFT_893484 [Pisolithus orientalis]|uniref:uncharacterized protein n=1 Tax=Pisolithus orientalis TaxID=936130 RepID=UPI002224BB27|nr:uncharacterized protein F5J12DRAFT_893484 [Pisolithus orientalis]KAI6004393.1 hypothetical protein F5J12DRAFT_893484 [Pisolithus orientalis]